MWKIVILMENKGKNCVKPTKYKEKMKNINNMVIFLK